MKVPEKWEQIFFNFIGLFGALKVLHSEQRLVHSKYAVNVRGIGSRLHKSVSYGPWSLNIFCCHFVFERTMTKGFGSMA